VIREILRSWPQQTDKDVLVSESMTMPSSAKDFNYAIWEAVNDPEIPDTKDPMCLPLLKMFLKGRVDMTKRKEEDCFKQFSRLRKALRKGEANVAGQSSSAELERKSDVSFTDSAYHSESPHDHVCC